MKLPFQADFGESSILGQHYSSYHTKSSVEISLFCVHIIDNFKIDPIISLQSINITPLGSS